MVELTPELVLRAYTIGVFPMAESRDDEKVYWVEPERRGVLPLDDYHIPRRLRRTVRGGRFTVRCNTAFDAVMEGCAQSCDSRPDSWINPTIHHLYQELARSGFAHSMETWLDGRLVGGLYGVAMGAAFFGESMFSRENDASKVALVHLLAHLRVGGYVLLDTQFTTDHLAQFGVVEISRARYRTRLSQALEGRAQFPAEISREDLESTLRGSRSKPPAA